MLSLLIERGARHHIFSAIEIGDLDLIQTLVEQNPEALDRRLSRFEHGQTPLHLAMTRKRYDILDLLIELGADLEAKDMSGQTARAVAMLRGDREAMSRLHAAGAKQPTTVTPGRRVRPGQPGDHEGIEFEQDIEDMFYGARQFCIRDPNGYELYFIQSAEQSIARGSR